MARKRKPEQEVKPDSHSTKLTATHPTELTANRAKMRALIVSALAAGGVFQMNSWQIQAHGNRSSHSALAFQTPSISPEDYILMRQVLTGPKTPDTDQLIQLSTQLRALNVSNNPSI